MSTAKSQSLWRSTETLEVGQQFVFFGMVVLGQVLEVQERLVELGRQFAARAQRVVQHAQTAAVRRILQAHVQLAARGLAFQPEVQPAPDRVCADQRELMVRDVVVDLEELFVLSRDGRTQDDFASQSRWRGVHDVRAAQEREPHGPLFDGAKK